MGLEFSQQQIVRGAIIILAVALARMEGRQVFGKILLRLDREAAQLAA